MSLADATNVVLGNIPLPCGDGVPFFDGDFHGGGLVRSPSLGEMVFQNIDGWCWNCCDDETETKLCQEVKFEVPNLLPGSNLVTKLWTGS